MALHHAGGGFSEATRTEAVAEGRGIQSQVGQGHVLTAAAVAATTVEVNNGCGTRDVTWPRTGFNQGSGV
jgi:hypothetical protein